MKGKHKSFLLAIALIAVIGGIFFTGLGQNLTSGVVSFSSASFTSNTNLPNGDFWSGNLWIVSVIQNGIDQTIQGTITANQIGTSGTKPQTDLKLNVAFNKQTCDSAIVPDVPSTDLVRYKYGSWSCILNPLNIWGQLQTEAKNYCTGQGMSLRYATHAGFAVADTCAAVCQTQEGSAGRFGQTNQVHSTGTISVTGKSTASVAFDSYGTGQGYVGNNVYYVYNGDLIKSVCPTVSDYKPYWNGAAWKITNLGSWSTYVATKNLLENKMSNNEGNCNIFKCGTTVNLADLNEKVNDANNALNTVKNAQLIPTNGYVQSASVNNGVLVITPSGSITSAPMLTFYIKADFLGIYQNNPNIVFNSASCTKAEGVPSSTATATLTNNGEQGCVDVSLSCPSPFTTTQAAQSVCLANGGTQTLTFPYSVTVSSDTSKTCTLTISGVGGTKTRDISCQATPIQSCMNYGETKCVGNQVYACQSGQWVNTKTCSTGKTCTLTTSGADCVGSSPVCGNKICETGEATSCPQDCVAQKCEDKCNIKSPIFGTDMKDPFCLGGCYVTNLINGVITWTIELIKFVLVCVLVVVLFFISGSEISKGVKKDQTWLAYVAGLIISVIIGYGIWMFI
jgi:hypothetical protein